MMNANTEQYDTSLIIEQYDEYNYKIVLYEYNCRTWSLSSERYLRVLMTKLDGNWVYFTGVATSWDS